MRTVTEPPERAKKAPLTEHPGETMIVSAHPQGPTARVPAAGSRTCHHSPPCPAATAHDRHAARTVAAHPEQGWSLLCNGVVLFDDNGELLPGGGAATPRPHRPPRGRAASSGRHQARARQGGGRQHHRPVNEAVITVPAITRQPPHLPAAERQP